MGLSRSAAEVLGDAQHLCPLRGPRIVSNLVERRRELTAADVLKDFALVYGNVATTGDRTREHVEKTSVAKLLKMSVSVKDQVSKLAD